MVKLCKSGGHIYSTEAVSTQREQDEDQAAAVSQRPSLDRAGRSVACVTRFRTAAAALIYCISPNCSVSTAIVKSMLSMKLLE